MKALIATSGGVASTIAAKITCNQGYECIGCTMKVYKLQYCMMVTQFSTAEQ